MLCDSADEKIKLRNKLKRDINSFIENGGKVQVIPHGIGVETHSHELKDRVEELLKQGKSTLYIAQLLHVGTNLIGRVKGNLVSSGKLTK